MPFVPVAVFLAMIVFLAFTVPWLLMPPAAEAELPEMVEAVIVISLPVLL